MENENLKKDKKFIFILNKEVEQYLLWKARETGKHKAEIVRDAVVRKIKYDRDYKAVENSI